MIRFLKGFKRKCRDNLVKAEEQKHMFVQKNEEGDFKLCTNCAEGEYWHRIDSSDMFCPHIALLKDGKCSAYRR